MNAKHIVENYNGGSLYLRGCDLKGITLPTSVGGSLYLVCCDLKGITLPTSVGGSLDLGGCDLKGITLPTSVGGSLYLRGCDLKGITLPTSVGGSLYLRGCDLKGITLSGLTNLHGQPGRAICIRNDYVLWLGNDGRYYAGCRNFTKAQALEHWNRKDNRACEFTIAIGLN